MYTEVTGLNVVVTSTVAGPMGEMTWFVRHEDSASVEAAIAATMSSEKYMKEVNSGGDFFMPGATQMYAQRVV